MDPRASGEATRNYSQTAALMQCSCTWHSCRCCDHGKEWGDTVVYQGSDWAGGIGVGPKRSLSPGGDPRGPRNNIKRGAVLLVTTDSGSLTQVTHTKGDAPHQRSAESERGKVKICPSSREKYLLLPSRSHGLDVLSLLNINPGGREPSLSCGSNYEAIKISHLWCMKTPLWLD